MTEEVMAEVLLPEIHVKALIIRLKEHNHDNTTVTTV